MSEKKRGGARPGAGRKKKPATPVAEGSTESHILTDPHRTRSDAKMLKMAVNRRWPRPKNTEAIVDRLEGIIAKTASQVMTKEGPATIDTPADSNAIRAASVLVAMESQNQKDDHIEQELARVNTDARITITVEVEQQRDRLNAIAQRLGLRKVGEPISGGSSDIDSRPIVSTFESGTGRQDGNEPVRPA